MVKIESVVELARYRPGDRLWWVVFRQLAPPSQPCTPENTWMLEEHPKVFFDRRVFTPCWQTRRHIPKLHASDFRTVTELLMQRVWIEEFRIVSVERSRGTGEFSYRNERGEEMCESFLFRKKWEALRERRRLRMLLIEWIDREFGIAESLG